MIYYIKEANQLKNFQNKKYQLGILKREEPSNALSFFRKFPQNAFFVNDFIKENMAKDNIRKLLRFKFSKKIQNNSFYEDWLEDMSEICVIFCSFIKKKEISFWLGSSRGCTRYHADTVPYRLLVTYTGQGTEILPDKAANRHAFDLGLTNKQILQDKSALTFLDKWDIAIFKGGKNGILHRTPDSALKKKSSILMRLDHPSFLKELNKINYTND